MISKIGATHTHLKTKEKVRKEKKGKEKEERKRVQCPWEQYGVVPLNGGPAKGKESLTVSYLSKVITGPSQSPPPSSSFVNKGK